MSQGRLEFVLCSVSAKPLVRSLTPRLALVLTSSPVQAQEFRGMWVSRFEWPSTNLNTVKATIESIMTNLHE